MSRSAYHMHPVRMMIAASFMFTLAVPLSAVAEQASGTIVSVHGGVWVERAGKRIALSSKANVYRNDTIVTDGTGRAQILFADDSLVALSADSTLSVNDFVFDPAAAPVFKAEVPKGVARFITGKVVERNRSGFSVETPQAVVGIRGTTFAVQVSETGGTSVAGIDVSGSLPIEVRNSATGAVETIESAGEAVQATQGGSARVRLASVPASQNPLSSTAARGTALPSMSWGDGAAAMASSSVSGSGGIVNAGGPQMETLPGFVAAVKEATGIPGTPGTPGGTPGGLSAVYAGTLSGGASGSFAFDVNLTSGAISNASVSIPSVWVSTGQITGLSATGGHGSAGASGYDVSGFSSIAGGGTGYVAGDAPFLDHIVFPGSGGTTHGSWGIDRSGSIIAGGGVNGNKK